MKLSIIITSFNSEKYLKYSIQSVIDQTYNNFEIIIVDDGSTDKSRSIIEYFKKKDKRIKALYLKKNSGTASIPRNEGVKLSKCDYVCFLDADDIWERDKLKNQIKQFKKNTIISFTSCTYIKEDGSKYSSFFENKIRLYLQKKVLENGINALFAYNPIILSSVLIKKNEFTKYYFDISKSIVGIEDFDLWLKIFFKIKRKNISFCDGSLVKIRRTSNSLNINYSQAFLRYIYCVMRFFLEKKIMKSFQYLLLGIIFRTIKSLFKIFKPKIKKFFLKFTLITSILYLIIFYTPLFWYVGKSLVHYDEKKFTKNLIILSGNGDTDYINTSYQRRYLDTKMLLEKNKFKKIFIMGRSQEIEESEIIRSLLIYDGIKEEDIILINKTFANTKENISELTRLLSNQNINNANFLTSPYHTKRSKLLWSNHKDKINIYITENINNPINSPKWKQEYKNIKVIIYEYMAIIYNKIRGWI